MSEVELDESITVKVSDVGSITLIADDGATCNVYIHPLDLKKLTKFLVIEGYNFPWKKEEKHEPNTA